MEKIMHLAAQYLATAAISFIDKKEDDSHTNLGWEDHCLVTHPFPNGDRLALNYELFSLEWLRKDGSKESYVLQDRTHKETVAWISQLGEKHVAGRCYSYTLHYELPYDAMTEASSLKVTNRKQLDQLIQNRDLAQNVIGAVLTANRMHSDIRIWPHHFDTGAFVVMENKRSIGFGMAMPDTFMEAFYFYVSGYQGHDPIRLSFTDGSNSENYYTDNYTGFALPIHGLDTNMAVDFCLKAIDAYRN